MTEDIRRNGSSPGLPLTGWLRYLARAGVGRLRGGDFYTLLPEGRPEQEPQTIPCRQAIFDPDHLSRVVACGFGIELSVALEILTTDSYRESPLTYRDLGPVVIIGGVALSPDALYWLKPHRPALAALLSAPPVRARAIAPHSGPGLHFFGHWLGDDCAAYEAVRDDPDLVTLRRPHWPDATTYEHLFDQRWTDETVMRCDRLILANDMGFSRRKAERYRVLRRKLRDRLGATGGDGRIVYIRRGPSAEPRNIVNAPQLEARLEAEGVEIVTPEAGNADFLSRIVDASVIISVEGSQACHAIYALRDRGALLVIEPPDRFYPAAHEWMRILDMPCGLVIGEQAEGGFRVSPDEVMAMTDRLLRETA